MLATVPVPQERTGPARSVDNHSGGKRMCPVCKFLVKKCNWHTHCTGDKHIYNTRRADMEASGKDGVCPPPPDVVLHKWHVWCGTCERAVGISGNGWREHVAGTDHNNRRKYAAPPRKRLSVS